MENILIRDLNVQSYMKIVINVSKPLLPREGSEIQDHEEQKINLTEKQHELDREKISREPTIYSIKTATMRKSERQIFQLIKGEFGIVENDVEI